MSDVNQRHAQEIVSSQENALLKETVSPNERASQDQSLALNYAKGREIEFFEALDQSLDVAVSILNPDLVYQYISQSVYKQLNFTHKDIGPGDNLAKCHELMFEQGLLTKEILEKNKLAPESQTERAADESNASFSTMQLADGTFHRFVRKTLPNGNIVSMATDITEIVEQEQLLKAALRLGEAGYWVYDCKKKTHVISELIDECTTETVAQQIKRQGIIAFLHPDDRHLFRTALQESMKHKGKFEFTARIKHKNTHKTEWCVFTGVVVRDHKGELAKIQTFIKNVTQKRLQAQELERVKDEALEASKAKSQFLANMSHEIRTPMNGVLGMAELLSGSNIDDRQQEFVKVIMQSSTALLTIINDILDFSKIEAGALVLDPLPMDLRDVVHSVAQLLATQNKSENVELVVNYPSGMPIGFIADSGRIRQILTNLIGNALKFTNEGHIIVDVKTEKISDTHANIRINVTDTGIGIEASKVKEIFNKFTQADGSTTRIYGGTGLGLSITKHLVEMMDGEMFVESELDKGSNFGFIIPLEIDKQITLPAFDLKDLKGKHALIVDDMLVNRSILSERLRIWEMTSDTAEDCDSAMTLIKSEEARNKPYDVILLDFLMPGMNGLQFSERLKARDSQFEYPVIMLSSVDQDQTSASLKNIGIDLYLTKPVREKRLHTALTQIFQSSEQETANTPVIANAQTVQPLQNPEVKPEGLQAEAELPKLDAENLNEGNPGEGDLGTESLRESDLSADDLNEGDLGNVSDIFDDPNIIAALDSIAESTPPNHSLERPVIPSPTPETQAPAPTVTPSDDLFLNNAASDNEVTVTVEENSEIQILVAEDFPLNQDVVRLMLAGTKFKPTFANNGKEAFEIYSKNPTQFQIIVMDVSMPVMDGYEATEKIQMYNREHDYPQIPIIALTGHALSHDRQLCIDAGMDDYMTKPVQQALLMERLEHHLSKLRAKGERVRLTA